MSSGIEQTDLENGLEVILVQKVGVPLVTVEIAIRAGSFIETPSMNGLTHLHEHMFFKANRAIPDQATYLRRLDELGTSWNGSTSHEVVRYFFTLPAELLREGLELLRDAIQFPLFLPEELEKERQVVIGEYDRNEAHPAFHLHRAIDQAMFWKYFSRKNVIGNRDVIATATREKLQFIQDQFYVPNNAALIVAGEFEAPEARRLVAEIFGGWERRPDPFIQNPIPLHPPMEEDTFLVVERDVRTASILLGWHGPSVGTAPDDAVAADVMAQALNHPTSRFQRALVDSGLASRASFNYLTLQFVGPIKLRIETTFQNAMAALAAARRELDRLAEPGYLQEEEISRAAQELIARDAFYREKARDFAVALGFWWSLGGIDFFLNYPERVRGTGVADLKRWVYRYLPIGGARTASAIMVSRDGRKDFEITPQAMKDKPRNGSGGVRESAVQAMDLENGMRLLSKTIPGSEVAWFGIYFRGHHHRNCAEEAGLEHLLLQILAEGIERTRADELARLGARVYLGVLPDYSSFGIQCLRESLDQAIEILCWGLLSLEYQAEDVERNRRRMLDAYAKVMDDPDQAVSFVANRTFYPQGHPYLGYPGGTDESLKRISLSDLARRRKLLQAGSRILPVLVGEFDPDRTRAMVERALGPIPSGEEINHPLPSLSGSPGKLTVEERPIPTCYLLGKFLAPAPGEPDFEALALALQVLRRKLFLEVRTRLALTYAVISALGNHARNAGWLYISTTRPAEAVEAMYRTVDSLQETMLPEGEFRGARLTFLTRSYLGQENTLEQGNALAREELIAGDYRRTLDHSERLGNITPADLQRVLRQFVQGIHYGVIGPREIVKTLDGNLFTRK